MGYPETMRDVTDQVRREEIRKKRNEFVKRPIIDDVTGLYNDIYFHLRVDEEMARAKLYSNDLSLIMLELGCLKKPDDADQNPYENKTLKITSDIIKSCIRYDIDLACRYSTDKFVIILPEANLQYADHVARNIQRQIKQAKMESIAMHAGIVQCDYHDHAEELIKSASDALLKGKQELKNRIPE